MLCQIAASADLLRTMRAASPPDRLTRFLRFCFSHGPYYQQLQRAVKHVFSMLDLFGDVIITQADLEAWVAAVAPAFAVNDRSIKRYIRFWDVAHKVRQAKLGGYFESTIENARDRRAFLNRRFGLY